MKAKLWSLGLVVAVLPLAGCDQETAHSAPAETAISAPTPATNPPGTPDTAALTNAASPETAELALESAAEKIVSTPKAPVSVNISAPATEVVKLAQAGVDENVMLSYVTNSTYRFGLSSDDIIY